VLELDREPAAGVDAIGVTERQLTADGADFSQLTWAAGHDRILAIRSRAGCADVVTVDPASGWVDTLATGGTWAFPRWVSGDRLLAVHESETSPPAVTGVVIGGHSGPRRIVPIAPRSIAVAPHTNAVAVSFPSEDGTVVHGRLLRPRDANATRRAPAIVAVHDGPAACAGDTWDGLAQYFVDKGYGWLSPNYRGSTGYGRAFEREGHGGWGVDDAADCLFAGEYLAKLDWIDEERTAILGWGHGGSLALGALTRDPGRRFAAGACVGADVDLVRSWAGCDPGRRLDIEAMMGHPSAYGDAYHAGSPVHRLDALAAPVLVVHGERDARAPLDQSRRLADELRRRDKVFEYVAYPTEGHELTRRGPRLDFARRLERFLDGHLL
jgi:dipeptidyl aminopeptidase/acylaminoacyl peptidase